MNMIIQIFNLLGKFSVYKKDQNNSSKSNKFKYITSVEHYYERLTTNNEKIVRYLFMKKKYFPLSLFFCRLIKMTMFEAYMRDG